MKFFLVALVFPFAGLSQLALAREAPDSVVAITIALDPDGAMVRRAVDGNARLRTIYPSGFPLNLEHRPHMTVLQRFVRTQDLEKVYAAISSVLLDESPGRWKLTAYKLGEEPWGAMGLAMIQVEKTPDLLRLQSELSDQIAPLAVRHGSRHAFVTGDNGDESERINKETIEHVKKFVPNSLAGNYEPNVTVGVAPPTSLGKFLTVPFSAFDFSVVSISVYQLGNYGTARARLKTWPLGPL